MYNCNVFNKIIFFLTGSFSMTFIVETSTNDGCESKEWKIFLKKKPKVKDPFPGKWERKLWFLLTVADSAGFEPTITTCRDARVCESFAEIEWNNSKKWDPYPQIRKSKIITIIIIIISFFLGMLLFRLRFCEWERPYRSESVSAKYPNRKTLWKSHTVEKPNSDLKIKGISWSGYVFS